MTRDEWLRVKHVASAALDLPDTSRAGYIEGACNGDRALQREVASLVRAAVKASPLFERPAFTRSTFVESAVGRALAEPADPRFDAYAVGLDFRGTERYQVQRRIGAGGMGVVYQVLDRDRGQVVALKTLRRATATDIYRLKREFRSLAGIAHPNLVCLYDLTVDETTCFFTMELVDGVSVAAFVRPAGEPGTVDFDRVRDVLRQALTGLTTLHQHGRLHRDIKPTNMMVKRDGRLVFLDFGLTSDAVRRAPIEEEGFAGTVDFLAPELHEGSPASAVTEAYALGVTLHHVLTGRMPRAGCRASIGETPLSPGQPRVPLMPGVPDDLDAICTGLLYANPERRLTIRDALDRLAAPGGEWADVPVEPREASSLVGRADHLRVLCDALASVRNGQGATVAIHGPSGIGKTSLVQRFLDEAVSGRGEIVLRGRCYEHESVPYSALDGVVDSLSAYLRSVAPHIVEPLIVDDVGPLTAVFPVMLQVPAIARAAQPTASHPDPATRQRLAFSALRGLLTRIGQRSPLVVVIDDLHWADGDSASLLQGLLLPPDAPPVLTLLCFRAEEMAAKPFLESFADRDSTSDWRSIAVGPLRDGEARALVRHLMPSGSADDDRLGAALVQEARGNPFLLEQLAHHASMYRGADRETTLSGMLDRRLDHMLEGSRAVLDVLSLCGRPMDASLVAEAAGVTGDERPLFGMLRSNHLVRNSGSASRVEVYHDRIRETLVQQLSPAAARATHACIAATLAARTPDDAEALFEHCRGAGNFGVAATHALAAARKADSALAFDRAASLYRSAIELLPDADSAEKLKPALADALTNAGRPHEAAESYLDAAQHQSRLRRIDLQRRAAEQFLIGGHIDRGMVVIDEVLRELGLRLASTPSRAVLSLLWHRARIRWRGMTFVEQPADKVDAEDRLRVDACWSVAAGLAMVDSIRAADFNTRHLLLALQSGEVYRVARAAAMEAGFLGSGGARGTYEEWARQASRLAERSGHPHAEALCSLSAGITSFLFGEWRDSTSHCARARRLLREHCAGATWEMNCADVFYLGSLLFQGETRDVARQLPELLTVARERGNLYFETELRTRMNLVWLVEDKADEGERHAIEAMERWSHRGFQRQHYNHALARVQTELYRGRAQEAWRLVSENWRMFEKTLLNRIQFLRLEMSYLRARSALLMAAEGNEAERFLDIARRDARLMDRCGVPWAQAIARLLDAAVRHGEKRDADARQLLGEAVEAFDRCGMQLYAAVARRRLGELGGNHAPEFLRHAGEFMAAQQIRSPGRIARLIAPGFADSSE